MNEGVKDCGSASNGRYVQGCRCDACRHAHVMAWKARELRNLTGRTYFVDAKPVRQRLLALYSMGYTKREIERFGVSGSTQYALIHAHNRSGKPLGRVKRETAEKLARVRGRRLSPNQRVPADAAALMVRDWHDSGIALAQIAKRCGLDRQIIDSLYHGRSRSVKAVTLLALLDPQGRAGRHGEAGTSQELRRHAAQEALRLGGRGGVRGAQGRQGGGRARGAIPHVRQGPAKGVRQAGREEGNAMQSIAEIEAICERNTLAQAEAYMNAQDEEPSARECFDNFVHSRACRRMFEHYAYSPETDEAVDLMVMEIGCAEECQEHEDAWCPMPWSGTMRCQGPKKVER